MAVNTRTSAQARAFQDAGCESVQDILNVAVTGEAFAVTFLGVALEAVSAGTLTLSEDAVGSLVAARAAEQAHYDTLIASGAVPSTTTFTFPDGDLLTDPAAFYEATIELEEAFVAAYLTAAQSFVAQGEPDLAQVALQTGAIEAEHRVGLRFFAIDADVLQDPAPNDVAFSKALFEQVSEVADLLAERGFIDGDGTAVEFPGPGVIDATGVRNLTPPTP